MFSNNHSSLNSSSLNSLNTPLKASVLLVTAIMLSACGSDSDNSYDLKDIFDGSPTVTPGDGDGATGGDTGATGGDTGATGGDTGATGGDTGATGDTGGDTGATGGDTGPTYQSGSDTDKTGVQVLNINAGSLGVFNATTDEFGINSTASSIEARADTASKGTLPLVPVNLSGSDDTNTQRGFKSHRDATEISAIGQTLPLTYTSVYKDFGDAMRIAHLNGAVDVALLKTTLPVDGVAIIGNSTQTLPTDGRLSYEGDATYRALGLDKAIEYGSSVFTADFAAKKVDGTLTFSQAGNIGISGIISGNKFSGEEDGYTTKGGFYGDDAKYLGGVYSGNEAQGTFGAEKK